MEGQRKPQSLSWDSKVNKCQGAAGEMNSRDLFLAEGAAEGVEWLEPEVQWEHSKTEAVEAAEVSPCKSNHSPWHFS